MNKHKTRKSAVKRFKVTKNKKVLHRSHGARHLKSKKGKKRLRHLKQIKQMHGMHKKKILKMLGR
ncbi:MAG TPA: 50S ribosomal protein L35 [Patescibacteria group bacterium]|nr:50S ribosomal protein L35 [Patescibacteria group bacterium]